MHRLSSQSNVGHTGQNFANVCMPEVMLSLNNNFYFRWDFKCYPVSVFAYRLLEQMYTFPLFHVPDLNPALYEQSSALAAAREKRLRLKYIKDFICLCRFAWREKSYFESVPEHMTAEPDCWSMSDFVDAQNKCLQRSIDDLIEKCEIHVFNCVVSQNYFS